MSITPQDIRETMKAFLNRRLRALNQDPLDGLSEDYDLLHFGVVDSLGFVELMAAIAERFGKEVDFAEIDPEKMTIVGPLCAYISDQLTKHNV
jgi:acyl carrier protein